MSPRDVSGHAPARRDSRDGVECKGYSTLRSMKHFK